jgi:MFS family permease
LLFGLAPNAFSLILLFLVIYSTGQHIYLPLSSSIAMSFASGENFGRRIGEVQSLGNLAIIITSGVLYLLYRFFSVSYEAVFVFASLCMILTGGLFFLLGTKNKKIVGEKRFVFRREYKMYYILSVINGARKQITLTFVPWLIIDIFKQPVTTIAALFFITCVINVFFKPWFGHLIDHRGERFALQLEAVVMFFACIGFAFSKSIFPFQVALIVVGFSYIIDKLMESASIARATYVKRLSKEDSEVARTLSMGSSMDHVVSMFIPIVAGYAWYTGGASGYMYVFIGGFVISIINFFVASRI